MHGVAMQAGSYLGIDAKHRFDNLLNVRDLCGQPSCTHEHANFVVLAHSMRSERVLAYLQRIASWWVP